MKRLIVFVVLTTAGCGATRSAPLALPVAKAEVTATALTTPVPGSLCKLSDFATPGDGLDDRASIQRALDACAGGTVVVDGAYDVVTPSPRPPGMYAMLQPKPNTTIVWTTLGAVIKASGDNSQHEYRMFQVASGNVFERPNIVTDFVPGTTVEQTHVWRVNGGVRDVWIHHGSCYHPAHNAKSGDCLQIACYDPWPDGSNDLRCWNIKVDHMDFIETGRSCIAVHSGLHGTMQPDGHLSTRFHHNTYRNCSDQQWDGEGSGGTADIEIDHSKFLTPTNRESAATIQIQASSHVLIHDNFFDGRGLDIYGCDNGCVLSDNVGIQRYGIPFITLRKAGSRLVMADEQYTMEASAGGQPAIAISQKMSAPDHVTIIDTKITQNGDGAAITAVGIVGLYMRYLNITYNGTNKTLPAIVVTGSGSANCPTDATPPGIRANETALIDSTITGPYKTVMTASGSYCGAGSFDVERTTATNSSYGLTCSGIAVGAGISGPVAYLNNSVPALCAPLVQP